MSRLTQRLRLVRRKSIGKRRTRLLQGDRSNQRVRSNGRLRNHQGGSTLRRKEDAEDRAGPSLRSAGTDAKAAAMLLHKFAGDPETEPGARIFFCRKEWLEDALDVVAANTAASIGNSDANAGAGWVARIAGGVCLNPDGGSLGTGVKAVCEQVGENLAQLARNSQHLHLGIRLDRELHSLRKRARGVKVRHFADDRGWLEVCRSRSLAIEAQRLPRDVRDAAKFGVRLDQKLSDLRHVVRVARNIDQVRQTFE